MQQREVLRAYWPGDLDVGAEGRKELRMTQFLVLGVIYCHREQQKNKVGQKCYVELS